MPRLIDLKARAVNIPKER